LLSPKITAAQLHRVLRYGMTRRVAAPWAPGGITTMAEPLEITLKFGDKIHPVTIKDGDTEAAAEAKQAIEFIIDLFVSSSDRKRAQPKAPVVAPKAGAAPASGSVHPATGGAK
jgi:hypothetical protein